jgi:glycosyltransferase involved in cell wall biosynthesis
MQPLFSICICTRNRALLLASALEAVVRQSFPSGDFEILVVDNASSDATAQAALAYAAPERRLRLVTEPALGLSVARNRAAAEAAGVWLAYLDDDAIPTPDWLERAAEIIRIHAPDLFGGPFYPYYTSPKPAWFLDRYGSGGYGAQARWLTADEYLFGANLFIRRKMVLEVGGFPLQLGLRGEGLFYGEETGLQYLLRRENSSLRVYYAPQLAIRHWVAPFKMSISGRVRQRWAEGRSGYLAFRQASDRVRLVHLIGFAVMPVVLLWRFTGGFLLRDRRRFPAWQNYVYEAALNDVATWGKLYQRLRSIWGGGEA